MEGQIIKLWRVIPKELSMGDLESILIDGEGKIGQLNFEVWRGGDCTWIRAYDSGNRPVAMYDESGHLSEIY